MDVAIMLPAADPQSIKAPNGAGKTAADKSQGEAGFAGLFAGLVADGQQPPGDNRQPSASAIDTAATTAIPPVFWGLLPFIPTAVPNGQDMQTQPAPVPYAGIASQATAGPQVSPQWPQQQLAQGAQTATASPQLQALVAEIATGQQDNPAVPPVAQPVSLATKPAPADSATATADRPAVVPPSAAISVVTPTVTADPVPPTQAAPPVTPIAAPGNTPQQEATTTATMQPQQAFAAPAVVSQQQQRTAPTPVPVKASDAAEPAVVTPVAPMSSSATDEEASGTGNGNTGLAADKAAPAPVTPPSADASAAAPVFASMVEQRLTVPASAALTDAAATPASADPHNIAGQIIDNARLISRAQNTEMVIKLKPEHLGELTLKIVVDSGVVSATFHTANAEVRGAIEASLPQLRQDMAGQGLKVDYVGVYASLDHFFANDQRHAPQQFELPQTRRVASDEAFQETAALAASATRPSIAAGGIDYRV